MKIKLNLLLLLFRAREHQLACRIAWSAKEGADTATRADTCTQERVGWWMLALPART